MYTYITSNVPRLSLEAPRSKTVATHGYGAVEQSPAFRRDHVVHDGARPRAFAHDGNFVGIASEVCDIFSDPEQDGVLIFQAVISWDRIVLSTKKALKNLYQY